MQLAVFLSGATDADIVSLCSWFIMGYTSKTPGTEDGITEPSPTFSTCFGQPFIMLHPSRYASMLADRMAKTGAKCWLLNTGELQECSTSRLTGMG